MDNTNSPLVSMSKLSVNYGPHNVLSGVDLDIFKNDFLGVIGPNGGGKTTLIKTILGAVPYSGTIRYSPLLTNKNGSIGYLPQINGFDRNFPITVREVVLSGLQGRKGFAGKYTSSDKIKAGQMLEMVGIASNANKTVNEISGGQLQRALLSRALIADPVLLILDEPANFVDNDFEKELYDILKALNQRMAIIMVSHDLGTISSVVKNIVCVNRSVHRHDSNEITYEQLENYNCPIQIIRHDEVPHTVLGKH